MFSFPHHNVVSVNVHLTVKSTKLLLPLSQSNVDFGRKKKVIKVPQTISNKKDELTLDILYLSE